MKTFSKYLIAFTLLASVMSCKKGFLDVTPADIVTRDTYLEDLSAAQNLLKGIYLILGRDFYNGLHHDVYPELIADNVKPYANYTAYSLQYAWSQIKSENSSIGASESDNNINSLYTSGYEVIRNCSYLIENVDRFRSTDPIKADQIKAECLALRALVHHELIKAFAQPYNFSPTASHPGIPYVTSWNYTISVKRNTVSEVYANIIDDLNNALELIGSSTPSKFIVNRNFVKAILARIYLYKNDFALAKNLATDVISRVPLMSTGDYPEKLFTSFDNESIFQIPPSSVSSYRTVFASSYFKTIPEPNYVATEDIVDVLNENPNDKRKMWVRMYSNGWRIVKFPSAVVTGIADSTNSYYQTVIRSSELYLIASEAYFKIGREDSARFYLDAIRLRAEPSGMLSTETGSSLLTKIYNESRKELAFEGCRMYELLRLGKGVNRKDPSVPGASNLPYPSSKAIAPIPMFDVSLSGISQNPEY